MGLSPGITGAPAASHRHVVQQLDFLDSILREPKNTYPRVFHTSLPGVTRVTQGRNKSHITFRVDQLPPRPWPLTIDRTPFTMYSLQQTLENRQYHGRRLLFPTPGLKIGNPSLSICLDFNGKDAPLSDHQMRLLACAATEALSILAPEVDLVEIIQASDAVLYVVLNNEADIDALRSKLPGRIANCVAGYCVDSHLRRKSWQVMESMGQAYPPLAWQPGMISSVSDFLSKFPKAPCSTPGILVKNSGDDQFLTVASHTLKGDGATYMSMPNHQAPYIGTAVTKIPFTDVALVEPRIRHRFGRQITQETETARCMPVTGLLGDDSEDRMEWNRLVGFQSRVARGIEGVIVAKSVRMSIDLFDEEEPIKCAVYHWAFTGQVEGNGCNDTEGMLPVESSGAAVVDEDGLCVGLLERYIDQGPWAGFAIVLSASELIKAGYSLA